MFSRIGSATNDDSIPVSTRTSSLQSPTVLSFLRRKSISISPSKKRHSTCCEPSSIGASFSTSSPLVSPLHPVSSSHRKTFSPENTRKLRRQRSADEIHVRHIWPSTKKSGLSPRKVTFQGHLNDDTHQTLLGSRKKIDVVQTAEFPPNHAASAMSSLQRLNSDSAAFKEERGNRRRTSSKEDQQMRNYLGKSLLDWPSKKPGMSLSLPSSLLSGSTEHLPSQCDAIIDSRVSADNKMHEKRSSNFSIDYQSPQTGTSEARNGSPLNSRAPIKITVRRSRSPVPRKSSRSPMMRTSRSQVLRTPKSPLRPTSNSPVHRRSGSPVRRSGSPASITSVYPQASTEEIAKSVKSCRQRSSPSKGRRGGSVGSFISLGLSSLFGRKSLSGSSTTSASTKSAPVPTIESSTRIPIAAAESPAREASVAIRLPTRGSAMGEWQHRLKLAHNYFMQWRFLNARVTAVSTINREAAWNSLISACHGLSQLEAIVTKKQLHLAKLNLNFKFVNLLFPQLKALQTWEAMEKQHVEALASAKSSLHAVICRLPLVDHAKADPQLLSILLLRAMNVAAAIEKDVTTCNSTAKKLVPLLTELTEIVVKEKSLLKESLKLLGFVSTVQFQEESLRCQLIQLRS